MIFRGYSVKKIFVLPSYKPKSDSLFETKVLKTYVKERQKSTSDVMDPTNERNNTMRDLRRANSASFARRGASSPPIGRRYSENFTRNSRNRKKKWMPVPFKGKKKQDPALVRRRVLEGGWWQRLTKKMVKDEVQVEPLGEYGIVTNVLYASDSPDATNDFAHTSTTFVHPQEVMDTLVCRGDPYEIRVIGMQVAQWDKFVTAIDGNELVLWSVEKDPGNPHTKLPYIHFSYSRDGTKDPIKAHTYVPIPESKSFVAGFRGIKKKDEKRDEREKCGDDKDERKKKKNKKEKIMKNVEIKFKIVEVDGPNESIRDSVKAFSAVNDQMGDFDKIPHIGWAKTGLTVAAAAATALFDGFSTPDNVMSVDLNFNIPDREKAKTGELHPGKYLRYGYYFFLSEPTDAKLYASVTTPELVQLMLKQDKDYLEKGKKKRKEWDPDLDRPYFPFAYSNYIAIRVTKPTGAGFGRHKFRYLEDAHTLEQIMQNAYGRLESPETTRRRLIQLGQGLCIFDSDDEVSDDWYDRPYPWDNPYLPNRDPLELREAHAARMGDRPRNKPNGGRNRRRRNENRAMAPSLAPENYPGSDGHASFDWSDSSDLSAPGSSRDHARTAARQSQRIMWNKGHEILPASSSREKQNNTSEETRKSSNNLEDASSKGGKRMMRKVSSFLSRSAKTESSNEKKKDDYIRNMRRKN